MSRRLSKTLQRTSRPGRRRHDEPCDIDNEPNPGRRLRGRASGDVFLVKSSLGEFRALVGKEITGEEAIAAAAMAIVERGDAEYLAVTRAGEGALLAHRSGPLRLPAIAVETLSAVGAGDSFLAAMVYALALGKESEDAFRFGLAAGAAAVLTPGTDLCRTEDVQRLFKLQAEQA